MNGGRVLRVLLLLLAIGSTLVVSTAGASPRHWHSKEIGGICQICAVAHLPVVQPPVSIDPHPPAPADWHIPASPDLGLADHCRRALFSRGPPA